MKQFVFSCLVLGCISHGYSQKQFQENNAPKLKFIVPHESDTFRWNDLVSYEISISDHEDGDSEYSEININEVFLVIKYLKDSVRQKDYLISETKKNYQPLVEMGSRSCFNCHMSKGTLIGPSFNKIAKKYREEEEAIEKLAKKIIAGGSNVWGEEIMPSHPDLNMKSAKEMVEWILNCNTDLDKEVLAGTTGTFKIQERKEKSKTGIYVLTAFYTDHGINDNSKSRKRSYQSRVLRVE